MQSEKIGFIGLGNMGHPMAQNLEKAGFDLSVYNRTKESTADFYQKSTVCASIPELVAQSTITFTMLTNDKAVEAVYEQILHENVALKGKLFVDLSTISQRVSLATCEAIKGNGGGFIDAPVAGSTKPAMEATLIIMVGGEEKEVQRARPYLEKMGKLVKHLGVNGKGLATKISINYFLATLYESLAETMLFSDKMGVARNDMLEIINESATGSGATKVKTPSLIKDAYPPAFAMDLMVKDMLLAKEAGADFPVGNATIATYLKAQQAGFGNQDVMGIIQFLKSI